MGASPCRKDGVDCTKRKLGCHDTCPEYKAFREERQAVSDQKVKAAQLNSFYVERSIKISGKNFRRRRREKRF